MTIPRSPAAKRPLTGRWSPWLCVPALLAGMACGDTGGPASPSMGQAGASGGGPGGAPPGTGGTGGTGGASTVAGGGNGGIGGAGGTVDPPNGGVGGGISLKGAPPTDLLCELLRHPERTTLSDRQPEFGFVVHAAEQRAYQILVASTAALLDANRGDVWDSGKTVSARSIDIEYAGSPLAAGTSYFWKVRIWDEADVESDWSASQKFTMAPMLGAYSTPREPLQQTLVAPAKLMAVAADRVFVDFGRHAFGWLELELDAPSEATVTIRLGERAVGNAIDSMPGGTVRFTSVTLALRPGLRKYRVLTPADTRNTTGDAIRLPAELGVVMPFRYVEVVGAPVPLEAGMLRQVAIHYPYDAKASEFSSSSENLNQVWQMSKYSMVATTFAGVYVDGDRERIPYEGDAYIQQLGHYSVDREFALARYSHEYLLEHPTWPTEWKQHSVMMAWADWMYTGNVEALAEAYDVLVAEKTLESHVGADGLLNSAALEDLVDWPEGERDGHVFTSVNTVVNAFFCHNLRQMSEIARALGKTADATRYESMAKKAVDAFNQKLFDSSTGRYIDGVGASHSSLHSNMLPLAFGLVPADRRASVVAFVKSRGMACSVYGAQYLLEGLYLSGEAQAALDLMTAETDRSWMHMLQLGATIALEAWDAKYKPNLDWNHAWGGAPANIVARFLLGVRPLEPGFGVAEIRPQPGSLTRAQGVVPTIRGPIRVEWNHEAGQTPRLAFELPGNTRAHVALPPALARACTPLLNGMPVPLVERDGATWLENAGSGKHELSCP